MDVKQNAKEQREYAWNYFQLHAGQRMATFNFFVVMAALLTKGLVDCLGQHDGNGRFMGLVLAIGLILVSFASWKLDQRVRFLVKHAETALKASEDEWDNGQTPFALFAGEETKTQSLKGCARNPLGRHMHYSKCFGVFYLVFTIIGVIGLVMAIWPIVLMVIIRLHNP